MGLVACEQMAVNHDAGLPRQPFGEIGNDIIKPLQHAVGGRCEPVFTVHERKAALHVKPAAPVGAPVDRLRKDKVNHAWAWVFVGVVSRSAGRKPCIKRISPGPDLARDKATRPRQQRGMVVVKDMRLALIVEFRQRQ